MTEEQRLLISLAEAGADAEALRVGLEGLQERLKAVHGTEHLALYLRLMEAFSGSLARHLAEAKQIGGALVENRMGLEVDIAVCEAREAVRH